MPVMITSSCWSRASAGSTARFFDNDGFFAACEAARFFVAMALGDTCGARVTDFAAQVSRPTVVCGDAALVLVTIRAGAWPYRRDPWLLFLETRNLKLETSPRWERWSLFAFRGRQQIVIECEQRQFQPVAHAQLIKDVG